MLQSTFAKRCTTRRLSVTSLSFHLSPGRQPVMLDRVPGWVEYHSAGIHLPSAPMIWSCFRSFSRGQLVMRQSARRRVPGGWVPCCWGGSTCRRAPVSCWRADGRGVGVLEGQGLGVRVSKVVSAGHAESGYETRLRGA